MSVLGSAAKRSQHPRSSICSSASATVSIAREFHDPSPVLGLDDHVDATMRTAKLNLDELSPKRKRYIEHGLKVAFEGIVFVCSV